MAKSKENPEQKIAELADILQKQFEDIGNEVKNQLIDDFDKILTNDLSRLEGTLNKVVREMGRRLLTQSKQDLLQSIEQDFGGSIFATILGKAIIPNLTTNNNNIRSNDFKASTSQTFLEMGKAIARSQSRNG